MPPDGYPALHLHLQFVRVSKFAYAISTQVSPFRTRSASHHSPPD
jgi:hypothetical protein